MKVTIFGGGGFIGSTIADRLLVDGHQLTIFERPRVVPYREFTRHEKVVWMTGDMLSAFDVAHAIEGADAVLHLVSTTLPKNSNDDPIFDVQSNLVGSLHLLGAMVAKRVPRILFISSGGTVYGPPIYLPVDEKHPTEPRVSYGITKLAIEKYLLMYQHLNGIKVTIMRVANPYGKRQRVETAQGAIGVFINRALRGLPLEIWGDGSVVRDYIHVSDVSEAFAKAISYSGPESIFNISSGMGTSLNELVLILESVLERKIAIDFRSGRSIDVPISVLANKLAKTELGWEPRINLAQGIGDTVEWMKAGLNIDRQVSSK